MERFKDLNWFKYAKGLPVTLIGVGGIGSWTAVLLARTGITPIIIDDDIVENSNISGQFFFHDQVMKEKVRAITETVDEFGGMIAGHSVSRITRNSNPGLISPITIVGTDNMKSRKDSFYLWQKLYISKLPESMFIDARLNAESFQIFCIKNKEDAKRYADNYLYDDSEIEEVSCTAKQTTHYAAMVASNIVRFITNYLSAKDGMPTYVPFLYEINGIFPDSVAIADESVKEKVEKVAKKRHKTEITDEKELSEILEGLDEQIHTVAGVPANVINDGTLLTTAANVTIPIDLPFE